MLTKEQKIEIILIHGESRTNRTTAEIFNERYPDNEISHTTVGRIFNKFKETGSVENCFKRQHEKWKTGDNVEENVLLAVVEQPRTSIRKVSEQIGVSGTSVRRILKRNKFRPFKPRFIHTLKARDFDARFDFCAWVQGQIEEDRRFHKFILFSDESTFTSNGTVSSQNCRWWADRNPHFTIECRDQYHFKVNVWCGIFRNRLIGPYFFRNNLNSETYLNFLRNDIANVISQMPEEEKRRLWFQQDGASIHSTVPVRNFLDTFFRGQWIGRYSNFQWPARSPDITPMDYFLWGYLKNKVYARRPFQNVDELETAIRDACNNITEEFINNAIQEFSKRTIKCMEREGRHVEM